MTTANKFQDDSFITDSAHDIAEAFDAHEVVEVLDRGRLLIPDLARPDFTGFGMAVWDVGPLKVEAGRRDSVVLTVPGEMEDAEYELTRTRAEDLIGVLASALRLLDILDEEEK